MIISSGLGPKSSPKLESAENEGVLILMLLVILEAVTFDKTPGPRPRCNLRVRGLMIWKWLSMTMLLLMHTT